MADFVRISALAAAVVLWLGTGAAVHAQGFFQSLFGFGGASQPARPTPPPLPLPPSYRAPLFLPQSPRDEPAASSPSEGGSYRTLCVRMCDGYYFPISGSTSRRAFGRDASRCNASCGTEARLFYHPASSGDAGTMIDLTGRAYARLPNAFKYRKSLVPGCACKPAPWAESELARHRQYAAAEVVARSQSVAAADKANQATEPAARAEPAANTTATGDKSSASQAATAQERQVADGPAAETPPPSRPAKRTPRQASAGAHSTPVAGNPTPTRRVDRPSQPARPNQVARQPSSWAAPSPIYGLGAPRQRWPGD